MNRIVGRWGWWFLMGLPLLAFLILPVAALLAKALGNRIVPSDDFSQAIRLSFETSLASMVFVIFLGSPLAFALARYRFPGRALINSLVDLPIVFPPAAAGIALLLAFGRHGLIHTSFSATTVAVVMAQGFVASPFYVRAAINAFSKADVDAEESAAMEGAKPMRIVASIVLPQCRAQIASGAITTWARALGEFGATILFAGNLVGKTQTMPLAIYIGWETDLDQAVSLASVMLVVAFAAIVLVRWLGENRA